MLSIGTKRPMPVAFVDQSLQSVDVLLLPSRIHWRPSDSRLGDTERLAQQLWIVYNFIIGAQNSNPSLKIG